MIVFFGRLDDRPLALAIERAAAGDMPYLVVDQTRLHEDEFVLDVGADSVDGRLRSCGTELELGAIAAVYARPLMLPTIRDDLARSRAEQSTARSWSGSTTLPPWSSTARGRCGPTRPSPTSCSWSPTRGCPCRRRSSPTGRTWSARSTPATAGSSTSRSAASAR